MKKITIVAVMIAGAMFAAENKPNAKKAVDPLQSYAHGMASSKSRPSAVQWQKTNAAALKKSTDDAVLAGFVKTDKDALSLLAQVKEDYATDPMIAEQIAAVSQWVMIDDQKRPKGFLSKFKNTPRKIWTKALLESACKAKDDYRKEYFLDQLRWCGYANQAKEVIEIGKKSGSKYVCQFAMMVARELDASAVKGCVCKKTCSSPYGSWALKLPYDRMNAGHLIISKGNDGAPVAKLLWRWGSPFDIKGEDFKITQDGFTMCFHNYKPKDMKQDKTKWRSNRVTVKVTGDWLSCVLERIDGNNKVVEAPLTFSGRRNPPIGPKPDLKSAKRGKTIDILGGTIDDFVLMDQDKANGWKLENGVLSNRILRDKAGKSLHKNGNIRTKRSDFYDFNLTYDVRVLPQCNSGVYLRGIYEIQVFDSYGKDVDCHNMAAYYGRVTPSVAAEKKAGEWQRVDVTLYKRHLTVVLNGIKIIDNVPVVGITGGAMSADEFAPGPIYLQGDHSDADFRNMKLTPLN